MIAFGTVEDRMRTFVGILAVLIGLAGPGMAKSEVSVSMTYLRVEQPETPTLSNLDLPPGDLGAAGALLGLADNVTTGAFLGQGYHLDIVSVPEGEDPLAAARAALSEVPFLILDAPAETLTAIADLPEARSALLFNVSSGAASLRDNGCRANLLHTAPSDAMRADALMQFLVTRRWTDLALISGTHDRDVTFAEALRKSTEKFQLRLRAEKTWAFDADMRRNASQEVPLFTQDLPEHDVLLIADEIGDFGRYIPFNTWEPRPVGGSEGIRPVTWSRVVEQWGAAQLQSRFMESAGRDMRSMDYAAWAAVRAIGEAVTRTGSGDVGELRAYMLSEEFELAGFKGRPLSFRSWNGQLRQPIPLVHESAVVAMAPFEWFLHAENELDTLGLDRPESGCEVMDPRT